MDILVLLTMGALAGALAGLLGIGGGIVIVPVLALVFQGQGVPAAVLMHVAIGTSLATIVFTSLSSIRAHHQHRAVHWQAFRSITPGIMVGAMLGAVIADFLPGETLRIVFAVFMLMVALQMVLGGAAKAHRQLPPAPARSQPGLLGGRAHANAWHQPIR